MKLVIHKFMLSSMMQELLDQELCIYFPPRVSAIITDCLTDTEDESESDGPPPLVTPSDSDVGGDYYGEYIWDTPGMFDYRDMTVDNDWYPDFVPLGHVHAVDFPPLE